ncbi:ELMO domain-containing protein 1 [Cryptotermes secundus]|uniref:ELMO domain-containing protein 1 n=1 Tax=Cryptotermes secundus TaxID=105785 RepID=A0A2J7QNW4_9NEOP|nr:ELMO domain-containing protein 2 [Cryptotermes secundus]PNF30272.1 ELMO domain-containing protein 1 [Cryptotermes secundus]
MLTVFRSLLAVICWYLRPLVKRFLRETTRLCELQRVCYGEKPGAPRSLSVEKSLLQSRSGDIKKLVMILDRMSDGRKFTGTNQENIIHYAVHTVLRVKQINPQIHPQFGKSFAKCIEHIWGYRQLIQDVETLRITPYDADNKDHENKLLTLWELLMPSVQLESRITKQWQDIGFQGDDPKTDFRGMGLLGLENLVYFAQEYPGPASHVLSHSHHPQYGYAFAIVGINLTSMAYHMLKDGSAKSHVYNVSRGLPTVKVFHQFYCYLFYEFDRFWVEAKPRNVMDFSYIKEKFESRIRISLMNPASALRINIAVDNI